MKATLLPALWIKDIMGKELLPKVVKPGHEREGLLLLMPKGAASRLLGQLLLLLFLFKDLFIWLKVRVTLREIFPSPVHSPNGCLSLSWVSPNPEASSESPQWVAGAQAPRLSFAAFPGHLQGEMK